MTARLVETVEVFTLDPYAVVPTWREHLVVRAVRRTLHDDGGRTITVFAAPTHGASADWITVNGDTARRVEQHLPPRPRPMTDAEYPEARRG